MRNIPRVQAVVPGGEREWLTTQRSERLVPLLFLGDPTSSKEVSEGWRPLPG